MRAAIEVLLTQPANFPLYQPIEHPDLVHLPAIQPCAERFELMVPHLEPSGTVFDIGCHTGWFCRMFARLGWSAIGVDRSEYWLGLASSLNELLKENRPAYFLEDVLAMELPPVDVALCLSVAMYLFKDEQKGWDFFWRLSEQATKLFMDFGGQYADRLPFTEADVVYQMLTHTVYKKVTILGRSAENRSLFLFER